MFKIEEITPAEAWSWKQQGTCGELKGYYKRRKEQEEYWEITLGKKSKRT